MKKYINLLLLFIIIMLNTPTLPSTSEGIMFEENAVKAWSYIFCQATEPLWLEHGESNFKCIKALETDDDYRKMFIRFEREVQDSLYKEQRN